MQVLNITLSSGTNPVTHLVGRYRLYKAVLTTTAAMTVRAVDSANTTLTQDVQEYGIRTFGAALTASVTRAADMFDCPHPSLQYDIPGKADVDGTQAAQEGVAKTELFFAATPGAASVEYPLNVVTKTGLTTNILTGTAGTLQVWYDKL